MFVIVTIATTYEEIIYMTFHNSCFYGERCNCLCEVPDSNHTIQVYCPCTLRMDYIDPVYNSLEPKIFKNIDGSE